VRLTDVEKGFIAGIIEGEGSIGVCMRKKTVKGKLYTNYQCVIQVANTSLDLIKYVKKLIGGEITFTKMEGNAKDVHHLHISGKKRIMTILRMIKPYLISKKKQCELMMNFYKSRSIKPYIKTIFGNNSLRPYNEAELEMVAEIRKLNKRGKGEVE